MIEEKLLEISELLHSYKTKDIGLLIGLSGINLAIYNIKNNNYGKEIDNNLNAIIREIGNGFSGHSHCNGISGFLWSLKYFIKTGGLEETDCIVFDQFNNFLFKRMNEDLRNNNWDFLHGAIGIGLFFLMDLSNSKSFTYVKELVEGLKNLSINERKRELKWSSLSSLIPGGSPMKAYNLGLAHGIASIIAFLTKTYQKEISKSTSKRLLEGAVDYLLSKINDIKENICYFPSRVINGEVEKYSRLAWCYGDLSIATVLYNTSRVLNDKVLEEFALQVLRHNTLRRDLEKDYVINASLCHGTAGIANIFYRMYWNTKEEIFKNAASFWFDKTLEMSKFPDGLAGYKTLNPVNYGGIQCEYGLLEGIAGIGLALHSWVTQTEPTWDECLLLS